MPRFSVKALKVDLTVDTSLYHRPTRVIAALPSLSFPLLRRVSHWVFKIQRRGR